MYLWRARELISLRELFFSVIFNVYYLRTAMLLYVCLYVSKYDAQTDYILLLLLLCVVLFTVACCHMNTVSEICFDCN